MEIAVWQGRRTNIEQAETSVELPITGARRRLDCRFLQCEEVLEAEVAGATAPPRPPPSPRLPLEALANCLRRNTATGDEGDGRRGDPLPSSSWGLSSSNVP